MRANNLAFLKGKASLMSNWLLLLHFLLLFESVLISRLRGRNRCCMVYMFEYDDKTSTVPTQVKSSGRIKRRQLMSLKKKSERIHRKVIDIAMNNGIVFIMWLCAVRGQWVSQLAHITYNARQAYIFTRRWVNPWATLQHYRVKLELASWNIQV